MFRRSSLFTFLAAILSSTRLVLGQLNTDYSSDFNGSQLLVPKDPCPIHCDDTGPYPQNWSMYHNLDQLQRCSQRFFLDFSISDAPIDDPTVLHRIRSCIIYSNNWDHPALSLPVPATPVNATFQVGKWNDTYKTTGRTPNLLLQAGEFQTYFGNGYATLTGAAVLWGLSMGTTIGIYVGQALQNEGMAAVAIANFVSLINGTDYSGGIAMQYCGGGLDADHVSIRNSEFEISQYLRGLTSTNYSLTDIRNHRKSRWHV